MSYPCAIRVSSGALKNDGVLFDLVDEEPVAGEVTFPPTLIVPDALVIAELRGEGLLLCDPRHDTLEPGQVSPRFSGLQQERAGRGADEFDSKTDGSPPLCSSLHDQAPYPRRPSGPARL